MHQSCAQFDEGIVLACSCVCDAGLTECPLLQERSIEKDVATLVKKTLDEELTGTWHVVVGESFGCSVTHETKFIAFFQIGLVYFLVFRSLDDEPIAED